MIAGHRHEMMSLRYLISSSPPTMSAFADVLGLGIHEFACARTTPPIETRGWQGQALP
jgi:hypothetical protein